MFLNHNYGGTRYVSVPGVQGATPIFAPGHKNGNAVSQLLKVVETWFYAQTNRNGHVYIRLVKVLKALDAYFFHKIEKP